ncbi:MAG: hypothetical protein HOP11_14510 [Saprospiraceae bacterium]|nr:hypothetical protein [Saprospiraceae bacterium]
MNRKIVLLLIAGIIVALAALGYYFYNKPTASVIGMKSDFIKTASELYSEFEANEQEATQKYQNKVIEVTGVIDSIAQNENGGKMVILNTGGGMGSINLDLDTSVVHKQTLEKGKEVTMKGICSGYLLDVVLNRSVVK